MNVDTLYLGGRLYVREQYLSKVLDRMAALIQDQRKALRTHDTLLIEDCKRRENGLLKYVEDYHKTIAMADQLKMFGEGGSQ